MGKVPTGPRTLVVIDRMLGIMRAGRLPERVIAYAVDILPLYATAYAFEEGIQAEQMSEEEIARYYVEVGQYFRSLPADRFPHIHPLSGVLAGPEEEDPEARFALRARHARHRDRRAGRAGLGGRHRVQERVVLGGRRRRCGSLRIGPQDRDLARRVRSSHATSGALQPVVCAVVAPRRRCGRARAPRPAAAAARGGPCGRADPAVDRDAAAAAARCSIASSTSNACSHERGIGVSSGRSSALGRGRPGPASHPRRGRSAAPRRARRPSRCEPTIGEQDPPARRPCVARCVGAARTRARRRSRARAGAGESTRSSLRPFPLRAVRDDPHVDARQPPQQPVGQRLAETRAARVRGAGVPIST